jgi:hypothetical protein
MRMRKAKTAESVRQNDFRSVDRAASEDIVTDPLMEIGTKVGTICDEWVVGKKQKWGT